MKTESGGRLSLMTAPDPDPETRRMKELVLAASRGEASPSEREELSLYAEQNPELLGRVESAARDRELGGGWLDRIEADDRLQRTESHKRTKLERGVGLALLGGGIVAGFALPIAGATAATLGLGLLLWSFVRVRLSTLKDDPYKNVKR